MLAAFPQAMPLEGFIGGLMVGMASAIMLLGLGRIAGVSGMAARAMGISAAATPRAIAIAFVIGLPLGALIISMFFGGVETRFASSFIPLLIGGVLVGYGTRLGSGCTSGHGVCGMSRLSPRSLIATAIFMTSGFGTVAMMRWSGML